MSPCSSRSPARSGCGATRSVRALFDRLRRRAQESRSPGARLGPHITEFARRCARSETAIGNASGSRLEIPCGSGGGFGYARPSRAAPDDPDAVVVRLDPGLAFGTGTHPDDGAVPANARCAAARRPLGDRLWVRFRDPGNRRPEAWRLTRHRGRPRPAGALATRENAIRNGVAERLEIQGVAALASGRRPRDGEYPGRALDRALPDPPAACKTGGDLCCRDS